MNTTSAATWSGNSRIWKGPACARCNPAVPRATVAGVPPLTYLGHWRMLLAQRALRDGDVQVGALASKLGYTSQSAFSTAFKRQVGLSPLRYRQRRRAHEPALNGAPLS